MMRSRRNWMRILVGQLVMEMLIASNGIAVVCYAV